MQTNKAAEAVELFDVIEVVDREKLARALAKEMALQNRYLPCYIQVNTGEEPQKSGILPDQLDGFAQFCKDELALPVIGLMCIPPVDEEAAMHFALLKTMAQRLSVPKLSMGMSGIISRQSDLAPPRCGWGQLFLVCVTIKFCL